MMCLRKGVEEIKGIASVNEVYMKAFVIALISWIKGTIEQKKEKAAPRGRENTKEKLGFSS